MMTDCFSFMSMNGMGWMMWAGGLFWLLVLGLLVLATAALIKYLRAGRNSETAASSSTMPRGEIS